MRRMLVFFALMVSVLALFGQSGSLSSSFVLETEYQTDSLLTDSTWQVLCKHPFSQVGQGYLPNQIAIGHIAVDSYGRRYRVKNIINADSGTSELELVELQDNNLAPSGICVIYEASPNNDLVPVGVGLSPATVARIHQHNRLKSGGGGGSGIYGGSGNIPDGTISTTNGSFNIRSANGSQDVFLKFDNSFAEFSSALLSQPTNRYGVKWNGPNLTVGGLSAGSSGRVLYSSGGILQFGGSLNFREGTTNALLLTVSDNIFRIPQFNNRAFLGTDPAGNLIGGDFSTFLSSDADNALSVGTDNLLFADGSGGGSTEVADGTTITGVGSVGDPFAASGEEIGHRLGEFVFNSDSTKIIRLNQTRLGGSGALVVRTGIDVNTPYQEIEVKIPYYSSSAATSVRTSGTYRFVATIVNSVISNAYFIVDGNFPLVRGGYYAVENGFLVVVAGETTTSSIILTSGFEVSTTVNKLSFSEADFSITKSTNITSLSPTSVDGISTSFIIGSQIIGQLTGVNATAFTLANTGSFSGGVTGVKFNMIPNNSTSLNDPGFYQTKGVAIGARSGPHLYFATPSTTGADPMERMVILNNGNVGIGQTTPAYIFDVNGTGAMRIPTGTTAQRPIGASSLWRFNSTTGAYEGHNGTSFGRLYLSSDATPTNGQVRVFNSASGMDVYTTLSTGTMSDFDLVADTGTTATIEDGETVTIAGTTGGIDTEISGNTVTVKLDQGEIASNSTAESDQYFLVYDAGDGLSWNLDIDDLVEYIPSIYNASGFVPSNTTFDTDDGAGITWGSDNIDIHGAEVTINSVKPFLTLSIPIYCQPHDESISTGTDYRGWRVPSGVGNANIVGIQYSFDTPGSDTVTIQLTNGTVNFGGTTIPATGYKDVSIGVNQPLTAGELIKPDIGTINGTGHEGLMVNLLIQKN